MDADGKWEMGKIEVAIGWNSLCLPDMEDFDVLFLHRGRRAERGRRNWPASPIQV
jgi:hypothetical protein